MTSSAEEKMNFSGKQGMRGKKEKFCPEILGPEKFRNPKFQGKVVFLSLVCLASLTFHVSLFCSAPKRM